MATLVDMKDLPAAGVAEVMPTRRGLWPSRILTSLVRSRLNARERLSRLLEPTILCSARWIRS
jgi:hypothetical protein